MVKVDHAALVIQVYPPGITHPRARDKLIPVFPGHDQARLQLNQTEYFRQEIPGPEVYHPNEIDCETHFDYLNHRGFGKERAELIYYTRVSEMRSQGFDFRMYKSGVLWTIGLTGTAWEIHRVEMVLARFALALLTRNRL
jgi:hypothetical protein